MSYTNLPYLPLEVWLSIGSHLQNSDIKSLRLTCSQFKNAAILRFDRVFLSANPLNIEVFRAVASHNEFRHRVTEIVWDDALLHRGQQRTEWMGCGDELLSDEDEPGDTKEWADKYGDDFDRELNIKNNERLKEGGPPRWFVAACDKNRSILRRRRGSDAERPDHVARDEQLLAEPPLEELWEYYQHLLRQQKGVLADESDLHAFSFGVRQFPALRRVTITPSAHGHLHSPLYPTPMFRAFPKGFNYPVPRGWLYPASSYGVPALSYPWNEFPDLKERYRGFRTVMRVLANEPNHVSELIMTSNQIPTGINCTIFKEPCEEYDNFATVLKSPGFRRLDIALLVGGDDPLELEPCWESFLNGRLRRALSEAKGMEDFRLHTTMKADPWGDTTAANGLGNGPIDRLIPLRRVIPVENWPRLRHLEISRFLVTQSDTISFLTALPKSVRSIKLSMLMFLDDSGDLSDLMKEMRKMICENTLWGDRGLAAKPKVTVGLPMAGNREFGRAHWIEKEVQDFIYGNGKIPFLKDLRSETPLGCGFFRDSFEPEWDRPYDRIIEWRD